MWSYYTKNEKYEGYCIEISTRTENKRPHCLYQVIYDEMIMKRLIRSVLKNLYRLKHTASHSDINEIIEAFYLMFWRFLHKTPGFDYEQEMRIVRHRSSYMRSDKEGVCNEIEVKYRLKNGVLIPYIEIEFPKDCLKSVTIAPLVEKDLAICTTKDFLASHGFSNVDVYSSALPIRF
jgi:hypothetical protein